MDWIKLKRQIYFEDGSLRDIYVLDTTIKDWEKWADLVNNKYHVEFWDGRTDLKTDKIDFAIVKEYWNSNGEREIISATIRVGLINVKCHFFDDCKIENDIDPGEIKSREDHDTLIHYLHDISVSLDKEVIVTEENTESLVLVRVKGGSSILNGA